MSCVPIDELRSLTDNNKSAFTFTDFRLGLICTIFFVLVELSLFVMLICMTSKQLNFS